MPLDPQAQAVIDAVNDLGLPSVWEVSPEQARINAASRPRPVGPRRWQPSRIAAYPAPTATFRCASTPRRATAPSQSWSGTTAEDG